PRLAYQHRNPLVEGAQEERDRLINEHLDVSLSVADAYSTLGWFKDPVTLNLIEGSTPDLVETILHEMTHTTIYLKGQGAFNEGVAVLVGKAGAFLFFQDVFGPSHPFTEGQRNPLKMNAFSPGSWPLLWISWNSSTVPP
ncbi:MAG TPA: hypothetical protein HPP41_04510, partial [Deltaproteobacteria bacterium]|nr:hypothetical protein [Deltaproteobacteria bacterium]